MSGTKINIVVPFATFCAGVAVASVGSSLAAVTVDNLADYKNAAYLVSVDEVKQNFAFAEPMRDSYTKTVKMSDGKVRTIALRPVVRNGKTVIEFKDGDGLTYMGIGGTTTNGTLMVSVHKKQVTP